MTYSPGNPYTTLRAPTAQQMRDNKFLPGALSPAASVESRALTVAMSRAAFANLSLPANTLAPRLVHGVPAVTLEDQLYSARAACKIKTNQFAMHFGPEWQHSFFAQLDALMDKDDWDACDTPVTETSFTTLIRLLLTLRGKRRPGLGIANDGNVVAAWTAGANRLTIVCMPNDKTRWIVSQIIDGDVETAAGDSKLANLLDRLNPYNPEQWFSNEGSKSSA